MSSLISIRLPYGKDMLRVKVPKRNFIGIIKPYDLPGHLNPYKEIQRAILNPIRSQRLKSIAKHGDKVAIVITDVTRRCPENIIIPILFRELREAGVRRKDITVVTALGIHRPMTAREIKAKIGKTYGLIKAINHNCYDKNNLTYIATTKYLKTPVWVNKIVAEADIVITTGTVEAHTIAGYSGGRKSIMPGVSGKETIEATHKPILIDNPNVGVGIIKDNPLHEDMVEISRLVGVNFIVNVVLNSRNEIVQVTAGDPIVAHEKLISIYNKMYKIKINEIADIIISSPTYPKDINLYQATRAANNFVLIKKPIIKRGGIIIIPALCKDGIGDPLFYEWMKNAKSSSEVLERVKEEYQIGAHKPYILSKILEWAKVIITNSILPDRTIKEMHMISSHTIENALKIAFEEVGSDARILISTHSTSIIPTLT
jgi:nickel-dependent lactate racemase